MVTSALTSAALRLDIQFASACPPTASTPRSLHLCVWRQVQRGAAQIRCSVCKAASKVAVARATKRKIMRDEDALSDLVHQELCYGMCHSGIEEPQAS